MESKTNGRTGLWRWVLVPLVLFFFAVSAEAGLVYGHVFLDDKEFPPGERFKLTGAGEKTFWVRTDEKGDFSVTLPEGVYEAEYASGDNVWKARVRSYPNPSKQDIRLKR